MKDFINRFISSEDKQHPDSYRKGTLFIYSLLALILIMIGSIPYIVISEFGGMDYAVANIALMLVILGLGLFYSKYGKRVFIVNLINFIGHSTSFGTYDISGGIYSPDYYFAFIMCAWIFLVGNKKSGLFWFVIVALTNVFYFIAEKQEFRDFKLDASKLTAEYHLATSLFCAAFLALIIYLYDRGKDKYVKELVNTKAELEEQKTELEHQKEDILSSINYAKRIQYAILPSPESILRSIPLSFFYYQPRDIVSGDFYWFHEIDREKYILVCADCTGHGVPGAFMTVMGSNLLDQIVKDNKIVDPAVILKELDLKITERLKQDKTRSIQVQDGMDLSLLKVDKASMELVYTSAKRPAIFIRDNQIRELKGSKFSIGGIREGEKHFEEIRIDYKEDDMIYLFTDGYIDQFGGHDNKKFMIRRFREVLLNICTIPMAEQEQAIRNTIADWKGSNEQTDDILVAGVRF